MSTIKLNSGNDRAFMSSVSFPVQVEAEITNADVAFVRCDALISIGAESVFELEDPDFMYGFTDFSLVD